jgi:hypothetical protein
MSTITEPSAEPQRLNGNPGSPMRRIGTITLNEPHTYRFAGYECAAWWQDVTCEPQTVEIRSNGYYAAWGFDGTVTDAYFASLWGGMPVGKGGYDNARDLGKPGHHTAMPYAHSFAAMIAEGREPEGCTITLDDDVSAIAVNTYEAYDGGQRTLYGLTVIA